MKRFFSLILVIACLFALHASAEEHQMDAVIDALKEAWVQEYAEFGNSDGYLQILHARAVHIRDDAGSVSEFAQNTFGEIDIVYEFIVLDNYFGTAPYYAYSGMLNNVVLYKDGTLEVLPRSIFNDYRARTYTIDFSGIIESVEELDEAYNQTFNLLPAGN